MESVDFPLYVFHHGKNFKAYEFFGAHPYKENGKKGFIFRVWAPRAVDVSVVGDFNGWDPDAHIMKRLLDGETFEIFVEGLKNYTIYKYLIRTQDGRYLIKLILMLFMLKRLQRQRLKHLILRVTVGQIVII